MRPARQRPGRPTRSRGAASSGGGGGPAFSPDDIAELSLWMDPTDESTITHTTGSVTSWLDKSDNAYAMPVTNGVPTTGARSINSLNVINVDGDAAFSAQSRPINNASDGTFDVWVVAEADATTDVFILDADRTSAEGTRVAQYAKFLTSQYASVIIGATGIGGGTPGTGTPFVMRSYADGANHFIEINGTQVATGAAASIPYTATARLSIAATLRNGFSNPFNGGIGEIIAFSKDLSTTERDQMETYLARWGVTFA